MLMELAFLLRGVGAEVCWITNQKPSEMDEIIYSLEHKMLDSGIQVTHQCAFSISALTIILDFTVYFLIQLYVAADMHACCLSLLA